MRFAFILAAVLGTCIPAMTAGAVEPGGTLGKIRRSGKIMLGCSETSMPTAISDERRGDPALQAAQRQAP